MQVIAVHYAAYIIMMKSCSGVLNIIQIKLQIDWIAQCLPLIGRYISTPDIYVTH